MVPGARGQQDGSVAVGNAQLKGAMMMMKTWHRNSTFRRKGAPLRAQNVHPDIFV